MGTPDGDKVCKVFSVSIQGSREFWIYKVHQGEAMDRKELDLQQAKHVPRACSICLIQSEFKD
jgi:hypothetical protein